LLTQLAATVRRCAKVDVTISRPDFLDCTDESCHSLIVTVDLNSSARIDDLKAEHRRSPLHMAA